MPSPTLAGMAVVVSAALLTACVQNGQPSRRPSGVPTYAIWAGGSDGGSYVWCDVDARRDLNTCTVWNDFTGAIAEKGEYRLLRENRAATKHELEFHWAD